MLETYQQSIPKIEIEEIKSIKYKKALQLIESALNEWGFDSGINGDSSFMHYVCGVIEATKDWSDNE